MKTWPFTSFLLFITFARWHQRSEKQEDGWISPWQKLPTSLRFGGSLPKGSWLHFLFHSHWYGVRGTSCAHFKRTPLGDFRLTCKHTQMQQSPPSPHPINQYCGDIIVKQARSLLFAPTHRREELQLHQYVHSCLSMSVYRPLICVRIVYHMEDNSIKELFLTCATISDQLSQAEAAKAAGWLCLFVSK